MLIKSVFNKDKNHFSYNVFLEKYSYNNVTIIYYGRTDVFEGIDFNKTNESKECYICH